MISIPSRLHLLQIYYLGTPVFFLLDVLWQARIRVSFVKDTSLRYAYYLFCLLCGLVSYLCPHLAALVGLFESSLNIVLLVLGALLPLYRLPEQVLRGEAADLPVTATPIVNFCLSETILVMSFRRHEAAVAGLKDPEETQI
jgi:hypothetical protein